MIFKLLVVDDESTMRKGIANFMNWDSIDCEVIGTASDGLEAIDFIKDHSVDIVITDIKMPGADGLAVAKFVFESYPNIKVILLTGYADFKYAHTAIRYNVSDFILKPTNKNDLFKAVQSAQEKLITSKKASSVEKEEIAFLKDQALQELTKLPLSQPLSNRLQQLNIRLDHYFVVAFRLVPLGNDISSLKKIIIDEKQHAYCYRYNNLIITIYFLDSPHREVPEYILNNCLEIVEIAQTLDSKQVAVGISTYHSGPEHFISAVSEAISALTLNFYSESNIALFSDSANKDKYDLTAENSLDLFQFENCLNTLAFDEAFAIINTLFAKFKSNFVDSVDAKNICSQIYYICSRVLIKKEQSAPNADYLTQIHKSVDIFTLESSIHHILDYTKSCVINGFGGQNRIVESTIKYIHHNLSGTLSLEVIAEHLHVSPSHLSRTFKKTCNESLTEFINKTRIEKAKEYLQDSDILTYEIAELVGYNDPTYFSSIFKKHTGLSPKEFRQSAQAH